MMKSECRPESKRSLIPDRMRALWSVQATVEAMATCVAAGGGAAAAAAAAAAGGACTTTVVSTILRITRRVGGGGAGVDRAFVF